MGDYPDNNPSDAYYTEPDAKYPPEEAVYEVGQVVRFTEGNDPDPIVGRIKKVEVDEGEDDFGTIYKWTYTISQIVPPEVDDNPIGPDLIVSEEDIQGLTTAAGRYPGGNVEDYTPGDKVQFAHEEGEGEVTKIDVDVQQVYVKRADGTEDSFQPDDLIPMAKATEGTMSRAERRAARNARKVTAHVRVAEKRNLICAVCGGEAGKWEQCFNQDTGYGLCARCLKWLQGRGESQETIEFRYGKPGVNYEDPNAPVAPEPATAMSRQADGEFAAGDRVRVKGAFDQPTSLYYQVEGTVTYVGEQGVSVSWDSNVDGGALEPAATDKLRLEKVGGQRTADVVDSKGAPLAVGDPVVMDLGGKYKGTTVPGVITEINSFGVDVLFDESTTFGGNLMGIPMTTPASTLTKTAILKKKAGLESFLNDYLVAALWSSTDIHPGAEDQVNGDPLDKDFTISDIAPEAMEQAERDCNSFLQIAEAQNLQLNDDAGHDFWLTRNGHGAGFWDGDYEKELGAKLTELAKRFGEVNLYVGDDGKIYASGGNTVTASRRERRTAGDQFQSGDKVKVILSPEDEGWAKNDSGVIDYTTPDGTAFVKFTNGEVHEYDFAELKKVAEVAPEVFEANELMGEPSVPPPADDYEDRLSDAIMEVNHMADSRGALIVEDEGLMRDVAERYLVKLEDLMEEFNSPAGTEDPREGAMKHEAGSVKYLQTFFEEKQLPPASWALTDQSGMEHFVDSEVVIEAIMNASPEEQDGIANMIRKIDFANGDVNDYLKHLAQGMINNYNGPMSTASKRRADDQLPLMDTTNQQSAPPANIIVKITYSKTTPESAEAGEFSDTGWVDEEGQTFESVEDVVSFLKQEGVSQCSSSPWSPGSWYETESSTSDFETGEEEVRGYHLYNVTPEQEQAIYQGVMGR